MSERCAVCCRICCCLAAQLIAEWGALLAAPKRVVFSLRRRKLAAAQDVAIEGYVCSENMAAERVYYIKHFVGPFALSSVTTNPVFGRLARNFFLIKERLRLCHKTARSCCYLSLTAAYFACLFAGQLASMLDTLAIEL